ncbi:molybdopterin molybdotransferase MoeA [Synechococcus sp. UW140]|uniref:molybdopterin molybdotransferase MoeA n=1 Tax=Synechococcus sp. UW140 TaxID=368503 RepID=UPI0031383654
MTEPFPREGLPLNEARCKILERIAPITATIELPLAACFARVSAQGVHAAEALPGFAASIMDGYAIGDPSPPVIGTTWKLVGRSAPGAPYGQQLIPAEAVRILTGAPLPAGAQRVLPQELVQCSPDGINLKLVAEASQSQWIRAADGDVAAGELLVAAGVRLGVAHLALLASAGIAELTVRAKPQLGLLVSGDELVALGEDRWPGAIWESNSTLLTTLLERLGYGVAISQVVPDQPDALRTALLDLAASCDLVVSTGGVSAGDSDWIRPLLSELGEVAFWKLFLKPGRPFAFGTLSAANKLVPFFGLPGNPVAAAITALQLLWPALQQLEGSDVQLLPRLQVRLAHQLRRNAGRPELARAKLEFDSEGNLWALVEGSQASSRISSLVGADLLLEIPAELADIPSGSKLWAQLLRLPIF